MDEIYEETRAKRSDRNKSSEELQVLSKLILTSDTTARLDYLVRWFSRLRIMMWIIQKTFLFYFNAMTCLLLTDFGSLPPAPHDPLPVFGQGTIM